MRVRLNKFYLILIGTLSLFFFFLFITPFSSALYWSGGSATSAINTNNSQYLQGLTPQQVANLYIETDPIFGVWLSGFLFNYNQTQPALIISNSSLSFIINNTGLWSYNQTTAGQNQFLNLSGTNANQNLYINNYNLSLGMLNLSKYALFQDLGTQVTPTNIPSTTILHAFTFHGFTRIEEDNEATTNIILGRDNVFIGKNTLAVQINKGQAVYVSGSTGNVPNLGLALANQTYTLPAVGVALDNIASNGFGQVMKIGVIENIDTSAFSTGDQIWINTTSAGSFTNVRPTTPNLVQRVGSVLVSGVGNGVILVDVAPAILGIETGTTSTLYRFSGNVNVSNTIYVYNGTDLGLWAYNQTTPAISYYQTNPASYYNVTTLPPSAVGNPFDQDLNTTNNVKFGNITSTGNLTIVGASTFLAQRNDGGAFSPTFRDYGDQIQFRLDSGQQNWSSLIFSGSGTAYWWVTKTTGNIPDFAVKNVSLSNNLIISQNGQTQLPSGALSIGGTNFPSNIRLYLNQTSEAGLPIQRIQSMVSAGTTTLDFGLLGSQINWSRTTSTGVPLSLSSYANSPANDFGGGMIFLAGSSTSGGAIERMSINRWGYVGINSHQVLASSPLPASFLYINATNSAGAFAIQNTSNYPIYYVNASTGFSSYGLVNPTAQLDINSTTGAGALLVRNNTNTLLFVNSSSGNIGIGTSTPSQNLESKGNVNITNSTGGGDQAILYIGGGKIWYNSTDGSLNGCASC